MNRTVYLFFLFLIIYLAANTGLASDDFNDLLSYGKISTLNTLIPQTSWLTTPLISYTHLIWYHFSDFNNIALIGMLKILYLLLSFYMVSRFFGLYTDKINAALVSFFFLFFPSHDSTVYWFLGQYLTLTISCYLYAYYLAYRDRLVAAAFMATAASFISYGSPPIALALFIILILERKFIKSVVIFLPNVIYSIYYFFVTKAMSSGVDHVPADLSLSSMGGRFLLQLGAFIDATIGPSIWIKIYYSLLQLSPVSIIIGIAAAVLLYRAGLKGSRRYDPRLIAGFTVLALSSIFVFSVTGKYTVIAFNLGNRTTIFGSLLVAYLAVMMPAWKAMRYAILIVLLFSILGISDHWKAWNAHVGRVTANIMRNEKLQGHGEGVIFVSGNQYSKFGPIRHIEFFSEAEALSSYFMLLSNNRIVATPLNRRHHYENGRVTDTKYGTSEDARGHITVYDSEKDEVLDIPSEEINSYIASLAPDNRHWIQLVDNEKIKQIILKIMPRLKYAL